MLHSVKYQDGIIEGNVYNVWLPTKKTYKIEIADVKSFSLKKQFLESVGRFVDVDSSRTLAKLKTDSLFSRYQNREELIISLLAKDGNEKNNILIREKACYHLIFKDNTHIDYGVVQKITTDSICISNQFYPESAATGKIYSIKDIMQLSLLKIGGYTYKSVRVSDYDLVVRKEYSDSLRRPYWYAPNTSTGEVELYRSWLTDRGEIGIMEKNGKHFWYEGQ